MSIVFIVSGQRPDTLILFNKFFKKLIKKFDTSKISQLCFVFGNFMIFIKQKMFSFEWFFEFFNRTYFECIMGGFLF